MSSSLARKLNVVAVLGICGVLLGAYGIQFFKGELPCPLCLLQRLGMLGVAFGAMLNLRFGIRPRHYGISLISALFGASVSIRQMLLHIVPGTGGYGTPILGLHLYTWAFIVFGVAALLVSAMLILDGQFEEERSSQAEQPMHGFAKAVFLLMVFLAAANAVTTYVECGFQECPDNPVRYLLLS